MGIIAASIMLVLLDAPGEPTAATPEAAVDSAVTAPPEPVAPAPAPVPAPAPAASPPASAAAPGAPATTTPDASANPPDTRPVVRPMPGNWGMVFIFGGLAPLSIAGLNDLPLASNLIFTELGIRRVFRKATMTFSFGAGVASTPRSGATPARTSAGVSGSIAVVRGFRVWRRIAPYVGGFVHSHYIDAAGPDNWIVNVNVGPILGVEYFIADRVGLWGQGIIGVGPSFGKTTIQWVARAAVDAGGHFGLTFYF
jgi:hypothetical protein